MDHDIVIDKSCQTFFTQLSNGILYSEKLTIQAKMVFIILSSFNYHTSNSVIKPSVPTIAKKSGICENSVRKAFKELTFLGLLEIYPQLNSTNRYEINIPEEFMRESYYEKTPARDAPPAPHEPPPLHEMHPNKTNTKNTNFKNMSDTDLDIAAANSAATSAETSSAIGNYVEATLKDKHTTLVSIDRANNVPANKYSIQDEESNVGRKAFALQPTIANSAKMIKKVTRKTIDDFPLTNTASSGTNNDVTATIPKIAGVRLDRNLSAAYRRLQDVIGGKTKPKSNDFNLQWLLFTEKYFKNQFGQLFGKSKEAMLANKLIAQYDYEDIIKMLDYVFKNWERLSKDKYSYYNSKIPQVQIIYNDRANLMSAAQQEEKELF